MPSQNEVNFFICPPRKSQQAGLAKSVYREAFDSVNGFNVLDTRISITDFSREATHRNHSQKASLWVEASEAAEEVLFVIIPSVARDLLFRKSHEKSRFLGQNPPSECQNCSFSSACT